MSRRKKVIDENEIIKIVKRSRVEIIFSRRDDMGEFDDEDMIIRINLSKHKSVNSVVHTLLHEVAHRINLDWEENKCDKFASHWKRNKNVKLACLEKIIRSILPP